MAQYVYTFGCGSGDGVAEGPGDGDLKAILGGKGAGLLEMCRLGMPVPPGFTLSTEVCGAFSQTRAFPAGLEAQVQAALSAVEETVSAAGGVKVRFGDPESPLLVSVRSGARVSMPGMMDTVLNLGLNDRTVQGLARRSQNPRFAFDSYRRFVQMYGDVVLGMKPEGVHEQDPFEVILREYKLRVGAFEDMELTAADLEALVAAFKAEVLRRTGSPFPEDPEQQLWGAISAVFRSWDNHRAVTYRRMYGIPASPGTAVNIQAMVFGNLGDDCATGVAFTRDPSTGERRFYGEFLPNAQGEDVVAGTRTPRPIAELQEILPEAHADLMQVAERLEQHFRDMQDIEFTIQHRKLWMLQTRSGKRSGRAMVRIAVEMVREGLLTRDQSLLRVDPQKLEELLHPTIDPRAEKHVLGKGLPASPGAATGKVVFSAGDAEEMARAGHRVILVRIETSPEDIHGMQAADGILTARGGMTSHAAVVARGMGKCCVVGASAVQIDYGKGEFVLHGATIRRGDVISLDGNSGEVLRGAVAMTASRVASEPDYVELMGWVDEVRGLRVRANADTPLDARTARSFGAEGIGLCRTEHMFFQPERILAVRQMILAEGEAGRRAALDKILPMQRQDFVGIFTEMAGLPVTIRLLDPPLHEFLPNTDKDIADVAAAMGLPPERVHKLREHLEEQNPMLGHRGCRLGVTYPEIYEVQVRAILEAAVIVSGQGLEVRPEIMIPLVGHVAELQRLRRLAEETAAKVLQGGPQIPFTIGTMIELPRACLVADRIAGAADFFSFGTNDLTQTTLGLSRDDAGTFLPRYLELGIYEVDPFVRIDEEGVGQLVALAVERGRKAKPGLKVGVCGEHGGDPRSVAFFHRTGLDYVSCSPFRVPIARLAAAQAAVKGKAAT